MDIDPLTFPTINLPAIWTPIKEKSEANPLALQIHEQAKASLLITADTIESILRLLLGETEVERVFTPPKGYDTELQGEWDNSAITFAFIKSIRIISENRDPEQLEMQYEVEGRGIYNITVNKAGIEIMKE
jgi:hypothetical protein